MMGSGGQHALTGAADGQGKDAGAVDEVVAAVGHAALVRAHAAARWAVRRHAGQVGGPFGAVARHVALQAAAARAGVEFPSCLNHSLPASPSLTSRSPPYQGGHLGEGRAALAVGPAAQRHHVVAPLLHQHADDALNAVADEGAAKLVRLLLRRG